MIPSSSSVFQCCAVRKEEAPNRAKASPKTETMFGVRGLSSPPLSVQQTVKALA